MFPNLHLNSIGLDLMMFIRMELMFILLFAYLQRIRKEKLQKAVDSAAAKAKTSLPATLK